MTDNEKNFWVAYFIWFLVVQALFLWLEALGTPNASGAAFAFLIWLAGGFVAWLFRITYLKGANR